MFSRRSTSTSVSRAQSFSDRGSFDMERTTSALQTINMNGPGRRTMSLEEEDEDDTYDNPWEKLQAESGPMTPVSEAKSDGLAETQATNEVTVLRISHLVKGCTASQLYKAFDMTKDDMRIEVQAADEALLHFDKPDTAMKAYFTYLSSTSSLGTVSPYEKDTDGFSSSPIKHPDSVLRNRRSFQGNNGSSTMLSALSNLSSWRSSDKLQIMSSQSDRDHHRPGHRRTSSRSSIHNKSTERIPSVTKVKSNQALAMSPVLTASPEEDRPLTMRIGPTTQKSVSSLRSSSTTVNDTTKDSEKARAPSKAASTAKRIISVGLGLRPKTAQEKEEKANRDLAKSEASRAKQKRKEDDRLGKSTR